MQFLPNVTERKCLAHGCKYTERDNALDILIAVTWEEGELC